MEAPLYSAACVRMAQGKEEEEEMIPDKAVVTYRIGFPEYCSQAFNWKIEEGGGRKYMR